MTTIFNKDFALRCQYRFTNCSSSLTVAKLCSTSNSLITFAKCCNFGINTFTSSRSAVNKSYSSCTIFLQLLRLTFLFFQFICNETFSISKRLFTLIATFWKCCKIRFRYFNVVTENTVVSDF